MNAGKLAIQGGSPLRNAPLPGRRLFDREELEAVKEVFDEAWRQNVDFGYEGRFEAAYTGAFCEFQGGGFADAVSTGSAAVLVALTALDLPPRSDVVVSPVTDPGGVSPVVLLGHRPVVADSAAGSFNLGPAELEAALTPDTRAVIVTHVAGIPADLDPILEVAGARGLPVLEDCSQAHGATYRGKRVGRFGRCAAFSTMFAKMHATGGCGGLVYTEDRSLYERARSCADRGKPFSDPDFNPKDPGKCLFAALNLNQNELACAIGLSTLRKLQATIDRRRAITAKINDGLRATKAVRPVEIPSDVVLSPFFLTVKVDVDRLRVSKREFAAAIAAEGIGINPDYRYVVAEWEWVRKLTGTGLKTPHASAFRETTFNILFNERYTDADVADIIASIQKVEAVLAR